MKLIGHHNIFLFSRLSTYSWVFVNYQITEYRVGKGINQHYWINLKISKERSGQLSHDCGASENIILTAEILWIYKGKWERFCIPGSTPTQKQVTSVLVAQSFRKIPSRVSFKFLWKWQLWKVHNRLFNISSVIKIPWFTTVVYYSGKRLWIFSYPLFIKHVYWPQYAWNKDILYKPTK